MEPKLTKDSVFPFGTHSKAKRTMDNVPVRYLHWVWEKCDPSPEVDRVRDYIVENFNALKSEDDDLIWTKKGSYKNTASQELPV